MLVRDFSNKEISEAIFTFLFASQDASSSLACWLFQIVADRPDVMTKIRDEQLKVRNNDPSVPLTLDLIKSMTFTNHVVKETLRYRPPVLMVPYVVKKSFPVTESYSVPKGAMVIPTLYPVCMILKYTKSLNRSFLKDGPMLLVIWKSVTGWFSESVLIFVWDKTTS